MLKQAFVVACAVVGIAGAGLVAAQAQGQAQAQAQGQSQVQACKDRCHSVFLMCMPTSSKNPDDCRGMWQTCDAACSK
jgi:hypothetical protein